MNLNKWLANHREDFASADGLPGEFFRRAMFEAIRIGDIVGIVTPHGSRLTGRATITNRAASVVVLNGGGAHGTPLIADARNTIYVTGVHFPRRGVIGFKNKTLAA